MIPVKVGHFGGSVDLERAGLDMLGILVSVEGSLYVELRFGLGLTHRLETRKKSDLSDFGAFEAVLARWRDK